MHFNAGEMAASTEIRHVSSNPRSAAMACSALLHVIAIAMAWALVGGPTAPGVAAPRVSTAAPVAVTHIVFLEPVAGGPGRGGGGGGNQQPGPIRRAEAPGRDAITLRVVKPVVAARTLDIDIAPLPSVALDAKPLASGVVDQVGLPEGGVSFGTSTGPGSGGGVGTGTGTGIGSGSGPGLGEGRGGGTGGGVYRPGGAVTTPQVIVQVRPTYTSDAVQRRVQGSVVLELIVTSAGTPARVRVVRSLDRGLDDQAIQAVQQWRFKPGMLAGMPVDVLVTVVLDFTVH